MYMRELWRESDAFLQKVSHRIRALWGPPPVKPGSHFCSAEFVSSPSRRPANLNEPAYCAEGENTDHVFSFKSRQRGTYKKSTGKCHLVAPSGNHNLSRDSKLFLFSLQLTAAADPRGKVAHSSSALPMLTAGSRQVN